MSTSEPPPIDPKATAKAKQKEQLYMLLFLFGGAALLIGIAYVVSLNPDGALSKIFIYGCAGAFVVFMVFGRTIGRAVRRSQRRQ